MLIFYSFTNYRSIRGESQGVVFFNPPFSLSLEYIPGRITSLHQSHKMLVLCLYPDVFLYLMALYWYSSDINTVFCVYTVLQLSVFLDVIPAFSYHFFSRVVSIKSGNYIMKLLLISLVRYPQ